MGKDIDMGDFDKSKYDQEYIKQNRDKITILVEKGKKSEYKLEALNRNQSLNAFIISCIEKEIGESD